MNKTKIEELKREIASVFALLQKIDAPMTENNVVVMNACLGSLKYISNTLNEGEEEKDADSE